METIVVGTDGSPNADAAVRRATLIAKGIGARLRLVAAFSDGPSFSESIRSSAKRDRIDLSEVAEGLLARVREEVAAQGVEVDTEARGGDPAHVLVDIAQEQKASMIIVGARGLTGFQRFLLGSVSSKLSHHAPCSLMIVRDD
jgi:nucleotide-binding universal stress UspA family protein